jgi:diguanylate cyclase (GGDEF)-like protein
VSIPFSGQQTPDGEVLLWQGRLRVLIATTAAVAELLLLISAGAGASPVVPVVLGATIAYLLLAVATATLAKRGRVAGWLLPATACADIGLVFGVTVAFSAPQYYGRALIFAFLALHLCTFYLGHKPAVWALAATTFGYPLLVYQSIQSGADLSWREELWSLTAFVVAAVVLLVEQSRLRDRLQVIARLFGRAEDGDFTEAYDEFGDRRPDSITIVGRAYNRVREQLSSLVLTDSLTGCENRRGFDQALAREVARATRAGSDLSLLAIDVDHFKAVNDTHGHMAGDIVLREFGALLLRAARTGDIVARTGGEEFCIVLPDTSAAGALQLATRLCDGIRAYHFESGLHNLRLTASIGVVSESGLKGNARDNADKLKAHADEALYAAKRSGRDRVRVWAANRSP